MSKVSLKVIKVPCDVCGKEGEKIQASYEILKRTSGNYCKEDSHRREANFKELDFWQIGNNLPI